MSRKKIYLTIFIFGIPAFLFSIIYYYDIINCNAKIIKNTFLNIDYTSLRHTVFNKYYFSVTGNIKSRLSSNKFIIKNLKVRYSKGGNNIIESYPFVKSEVIFYDKGIKIKEYMKLPIGNNWEYEEVDLTEKEIIVSPDGNIKVRSNLLVPHSKAQQETLNAFREVITKLRNKVGSKLSNDLSKKNIKQYGKHFINKLLLCAINGDSIAYNTLQNLKTKIINKDMHYYENALEKCRLLKTSVTYVK